MVECRSLRIAKLGTRPKGGSPKDKCEFKSKEPGPIISNFGLRNANLAKKSSFFDLLFAFGGFTDSREDC